MAIISYLGHSSFQIVSNGKKIITDPFIRPNDLASDIVFEDLEADYILVSHGHEDHTADLLDLANQTGAVVLCAFEVHTWLNEHGYSNSHPMNIGGSVIMEGIGRVKMVVAKHSSSLANREYMGSATGFVVENEEDCFYFAGDTALTYDMKLIADEFDLDFAFLPIGDNFTMGAKDASRAAEFVNCRKVIGMHYDTFGYIKIDHNAVRLPFEEKGAELVLPEIGNTIEISGSLKIK